MTAALMLTQVATECPGIDCNWLTFHFYPEPILHTHLIEQHGYNDTTAHVLAAEAVAPAKGEDTSPPVCRYCSVSIGIHDEDAWDEWTATEPPAWQDTALCYASPNHHHEPKA
jgi:hypothetical protein